MSLGINAEAPNFPADTTQGEINLHERIDGGPGAPLPYLRIVRSA